MLELKNVHTFYGHIHALKGISLTVEEGEIVTLIGSNGAGKTTTLRTISGLLTPREGEIWFEGQRIDGLPAHKITEMGIAHCPEGRKIFGRLTVRENLELGAFLRKDKDGIKEDFERVLNLFPRLRERLKQPGGTLSGGEQQMLAIGRALMSRPRILLLDEPSMGLAPILVQQIFDIIKEINEQGTTVLLVEQNARLALSIATRGYVLETGRIRLAGPAAELMDSEEVKAAYLGG
ncbi:MAG: ABC transporter ATP-binding protein [Ardenticatenia bacterium]|uniref:Amino acid ABC transporter ATPase n=1 Tax=Ardenticatena maritima TaxID=872965 RepID=A0A0M8K9K9_9CHLR|nr:ABC transporter ATP-binding protein [Ardenticatena maritima]KPL86976.1 amino acid ABC transporter ATPase [Ardenticatena maritima]RME13699.1 MAG: ABC transporter ATP-binding protein [Ardenticatenia bacterium]GAP63661.1 branched-chain amino acid transport system ATP-binding protein [Ardenticatena maritima]